MKVSNAVIGDKVQIKHDCVGHSGEFIKKGLVCTVSRISGSDYELRLEHPDIDCGFAWVNASDCRKYTEVTEEEPIEPTPEPVGESEEAPVLTHHEYKVGDKVLVGAEGAGNNYVLKEYANLVCTITEVNVFGNVNLVEIQHPNVMSGQSYTSKLEYLAPHAEPTPELTCADVQVGDWLVATDVDTNLVAGVAYRVVGFSTSTGRVGVAVHTSTVRAWQRVYYLHCEAYSKVLREVTPNPDTSNY